MRRRVKIVTLGCAKNVVDSEEIMAQLTAGGITIEDNGGEADILVINTCGFIESAKQESIDSILEGVEWKREKNGRKVYVTGCLSERYAGELRREIPEVDAYFGSNNFAPVLKKIGVNYKKELLGERCLTTPTHYGYLKISEGCDNPCSFCAIPLMRGGHKSKPIEQIEKEARYLASRGVRELIIIGQDTTYYGLDLYGKRRLQDLLRLLGELNLFRWIRLMYAYPAKFPADLINVFNSVPSIVPYIDIPIQHISIDVLRSMRRGISRKGVIRLLDNLRNKIPDITLRTTLIVGYPAEGENEFNELANFVAEGYFHRLGVFKYSQEDSTAAAALGDPVSPEEKERRRGVIMEIQQNISRRRNVELEGTTVEVLIDENTEGVCYGRTVMDAPEIDNQVIIADTSMTLSAGDWCKVLIEEGAEYDLFGSVTEIV